MTITEAVESHLARIDLALAGCKDHAAELPREVETARALLQCHQEAIHALNAEADAARMALDKLGQRIHDELREAAHVRADLLRLVEESYGSRDPRMRAFRPASEARLHAPRVHNSRYPSDVTGPSGVQAQ